MRDLFGEHNCDFYAAIELQSLSCEIGFVPQLARDLLNLRLRLEADASAVMQGSVHGSDRDSERLSNFFDASSFRGTIHRLSNRDNRSRFYVTVIPYLQGNPFLMYLRRPNPNFSDQSITGVRLLKDLRMPGIHLPIICIDIRTSSPLQVNTQEVA
jgi:hypothetical protein